MFTNHNSKINKFALESADNLAKVILMVSLSIQQNWLSVGDQIKDVEKLGIDSRFLWGNKKNTYIYTQKHKHRLLGQVKAVLASSKSEKDKSLSLMKIFLRIPGLGLAKAGFSCQLITGLVGCMDSHNIKLYGLSNKDLSLPANINSPMYSQKITNYVAMCLKYGSENLWNTWCDLLATKSKKWNDGYHVSRVHYSYLTQ